MKNGNLKKSTIFSRFSLTKMRINEINGDERIKMSMMSIIFWKKLEGVG
ncbi:MAG: hypothetical protein ACP5TO_06500 [Thermoplasmata archaeon]